MAFGVGPTYDYENGEKLVDYGASAAVRVKVRELARIGRIIDLALSAGATDVGNIVYESDSLESGRRQALTQALAKAQGDAQALARAAGGGLGRLIEVNARDNAYPGMYFAGYTALRGAMAAQSVDTAITPQDVVVRVSVEARWEYVPAR